MGQAPGITGLDQEVWWRRGHQLRASNAMSVMRKPPRQHSEMWMAESRGAQLAPQEDVRAAAPRLGDHLLAKWGPAGLCA